MGNYTTDILTEISRPGIIDKQVQKAIVGNNPLYWAIAGKYQGETKAKKVPAFVEETNVGTGYFEHFVLLKENANITWRSRTEGVATDEIDLGDRPKIPVRSLVGSIPLYDFDVDLNEANTDRIVKLVTAALEQAQGTAMNLMGTGMFSVGTEYASKVMWGLRYWNPDTVTSGSVAGIDQATETNWRSYVSNQSGNSFATYAEAAIETLILETAFNENFSDLLVTDKTSFGRLKALIKTREHYIQYDEEYRKAGFRALEYSGKCVIPDAACPAGSIFAIPTKLTKILVVKGCNFQIGPFVEPVGDQFKAAKFKARLNMLQQQRKPTGKIVNFTTA